MQALLELFAESPFGPLQDHAKKVQETVLLLKPLIIAWADNNREKMDGHYHAITKLEHEADIKKGNIRDHLPKSIFMPVQRGDMLKYLKEQDNIADAVEDVAVVLIIRNTVLHPSLKEKIFQFVDKLEETFDTFMTASDTFKKSISTSFGSKELDVILNTISKIDYKEWECDQIQLALAKEVFKIESALDPTTIEFYMKIFVTLGKVANHTQNTSDMMRLMLTR